MRFFLIPAVAAASLLVACTSTQNVPPPNDPLAQDWSSKIQASYPKWQPPRAMPKGNPEYAAAVSANTPSVLQNLSEQPTEPFMLAFLPDGKFLVNGDPLSKKDLALFFADAGSVYPGTEVLLNASGVSAERVDDIRKLCTACSLNPIAFYSDPSDPMVSSKSEETTVKPSTPKNTTKAATKWVVDTSLSATEYKVQKGETLSSIAKKQYKDGTLWQIIFQANKSLLKDNPNKLRPGMTLSVPAIKKADSSR